MEIYNILKQEFNIKQEYVENIVKLIDEGNTIPFIARYRKELTGSLDDQILREFYERLVYIRNLEEKKEQITRLIEEQEALTDEIAKSINLCSTITELDDIYRPFKPKRRTRATIAKEQGLEPLAQFILEQDKKVTSDVIKEFLDLEKGIETEEDAINGAKDIIAEIISDNPSFRSLIRKETIKSGLIVSKTKTEESSVYEMYYDFSEPVRKIAGHRVLAINRGEKENVLSVSIDIDIDLIYKILHKNIINFKSQTKELLEEVIEDSYKRLIAPYIEREVRNLLIENAEESSIKVFAKNLNQLLLQAPIKDKIILSIDPGFRTGCKVAVIDYTGKVLDTGVIYPTKPKEDIEGAKATLKKMILKYDVYLICIGNGTASRETEQVVVQLIKDIPSVYYTIVNEAGASVYSASKLASEELPEYDVSIRSAVSIARRIQDPLAELVKIDPKSIGVGQYQHDMNKKRLSESLQNTIEYCVNTVGVDLNTASPALLSYVSGVSSSVAKNIIDFREKNGKFKNRRELLKVKSLGPKAFEQCAGFLRIVDGEHILDNTAVHPESYDIAIKFLDKIGIDFNEFSKNRKLKNVNLDIERFCNEFNVGIQTISDIIKELEKPGRDAREDMPKPVLRSEILSMEDLKEGMILKGTIRNVIDFGAFVDIGVHQDGLIHITEFSDKFIKHPLEVVSVGDIVDVRVLEVNIEKKRIALSMKQT